MSPKYEFSISRNKLIFLGVCFTFLVGSSAYGLSVGNSPASGYLLCANQKTHALIYPMKLVCPSGYSILELGAQGAPGQDGSQGLQGPVGNQGPQGPSGVSTDWFGSIPSRDIVGTAGATTFAALKKTIIASISPSNLSGGGEYVVTADLAGSWASQTSNGAYIQCYFQNASDYPNGSYNLGSASATNNSWTGINLHISGYPSDSSLSKSNLYLVCATDGVVSGLVGYLNATGTTNLVNLNIGVPPAS